VELTLNLVWVCVAVAGIVLQWLTLARSVRSSDGAACTRQKVVAMACALVILFFVISMTDDLHAQQVLVEERKSSRMAAVVETAAHSTSAKSIPIDFLLLSPPPVLSLNLLIVRRAIETCEVLPVATIVCDDLCGRAPPPSFT
jgi:hypothetical protein